MNTYGRKEYVLFSSTCVPTHLINIYNFETLESALEDYGGLMSVLLKISMFIGLNLQRLHHCIVTVEIFFF